jgi:hypothetical protein
MANSRLRAEVTWVRRDGVDAVRIISSTYKRRYAVSEPRRRMKREASDLDSTNPMVRANEEKR